MDSSVVINSNNVAVISGDEQKYFTRDETQVDVVRTRSFNSFCESQINKNTTRFTFTIVRTILNFINGIIYL